MVTPAAVRTCSAKPTRAAESWLPAMATTWAPAPRSSHTAHDIVTAMTGVYGDRSGIPVANSNVVAIRGKPA